jgi:hypothetical protein
MFSASPQFDCISVSLYKCRSSKMVQVIGLGMANVMKIGQLDSWQKAASLSRRDKSLVELSDNWFVRLPASQYGLFRASTKALQDHNHEYSQSNSRRLLAQRLWEQRMGFSIRRRS